MLIGTVFIPCNGLHGRDAPVTYGLPKTLDVLWVCKSRARVFVRVLIERADAGALSDTIMTDVEPVARHGVENHWRVHLKAHRTAASLGRKKGTAGASSADARAA